MLGLGRGRRKRTRTTGTSLAAYFTARRAGGRTEKDLHPQAPRRAADPAYSFQAWELATRSGAALLWRAPTGLALPVVKVLADGTYLSVLINPKIRGARRRAAILAAATGIAEGTGADEDTDVSTELDRPIGKERVTCRHLTSGPELGGLDVSELVGFDESGLLAEVAVDRGAGDAEFVGDLLDGVCALAVGAGLVVHLPGEADLARSEFGFLSAGTSACSGRCQPVERSLGHQRVFKLGDRAQDLEEHPAYGGGGVDALVEHHQIDTASLQLVGQLDEVFKGTAEPIQFGDHELVAGPVRR